MRRDRELIGQTVRIIQGPFKGGCVRKNVFMISGNRHTVVRNVFNQHFTAQNFMLNGKIKQLEIKLDVSILQVGQI